MSIYEIGLAGYQTLGGTKSANRQTVDKCFVPLTSHVCASEHYRIELCHEQECANVYDRQGELLGSYDYGDLFARQDMESGKQFLISEHGASDYDAMLLDDEMKENLQRLMGNDALNVQCLAGYSLMTHAGTGIQYLIRQGEEGRGGLVLLQNAADVQSFEALAQTYFSQYPDLIGSMDEAYIWAELEIKGVAFRTADGIVEFGYEGVFYHDSANPAKDWSISFSGNTYQELSGWVQSGGERMQDRSVWENALQRRDDRAQRNFWEKRQEKPRRVTEKRRSESREVRARKEQRRQAKLEQEHKRKRRARYVRIMEESSWKRKLQSQEAIRNYYQSGISAEVVSFIVSDRGLTHGKTEGCVRCTFAGNHPGKLDTVYYMYYSPDCIRCIREGERNPKHPGQKLGIDVLQWEIPLEDAQQYESVSEFLAQLPEEEDLCFAADESFWRKFLEGLPYHSAEEPW